MKALSNFMLPLLSFALTIILMAGCKKDKDDNKPASRNVKYEITGTFSGKFSVLISDNESGSQVIDNITLPWSKEYTYSTKVIAIGIGATVTTQGAAAQTAVMKIYSGSTVVKSTNATADSNGHLSLPALGHSF